jgi:hypothetical protein
LGEVVLVLEKPWKGDNARAYVGLGGARMMWLSAWENAGGSKRRIVSVYPQTWRARLFGKTVGTLPLERAFARSSKSSRARGMGHGLPPEIGPDEAAAICIGKWATHAGEVGAVLPKRVREAA